MVWASGFGAKENRRLYQFLLRTDGAGMSRWPQEGVEVLFKNAKL